MDNLGLDENTDSAAAVSANADSKDNDKETRTNRQEFSESSKKRMQKRWAAQVALGVTPPRNEAENEQRLKDSHGY